MIQDIQHTLEEVFEVMWSIDPQLVITYVVSLNTLQYFPNQSKQIAHRHLQAFDQERVKQLPVEPQFFHFFPL